MTHTPQPDITLAVDANVIAALKLFAGTHDLRAYLNGICLDIGPLESRLIATDGTRMAAYRLAQPQPDVSEALRGIIIPTELFKPVKPYTRSSYNVHISIGQPAEHDPDHARLVRVTSRGLTTTGTTIFGRYPDWRRAIPRQVSGQLAHYNARIVGLLGKAYEVLHRGRYGYGPRIGHNGRDFALVDMGEPDMLCVIGPVRDAAGPSNAPDWVHDWSLGQSTAPEPAPAAAV